MLPTAFVLLRTLVRSFYLTLFLLLSVQFVAVGLTYYTLSNGDWNSTTIWSTNGVTGCSCAPSNTIDGFDVVVRHTVTMTSGVFIRSGNVLTLDVNSELNGAFDITIENGDLTSNGVISIKELKVKSNGTATFNGPVTTSSNLTQEGSTTFNAIITVNGNLKNKVGAFLIATKNCQINIQSGNLDNSGSIDFDSVCVELNSGNFKNLSGGTIQGIGGVNVQSGNVSNSSTWNTTVDWCAAGTDAGMPQAEKCPSNNCALGAPLPIRLVFFRGHLKEDNVILTWQTATESNNEYFTIERIVSTHRNDSPLGWEEIDVVPGAGSSNTLRSYKLVDKLPLPSAPSMIIYYRLKQTDYDGAYEYSDAVAVSVLRKVKFAVHPNPSPGIVTTDIYVDRPQVMHFTVYDLLGRSIYEEEFVQSPGNMRRQIDLTGHSKGVYNLKLTTSFEGAIHKPIVLN